ncbi:MAG: HEAT repeat domain-containing protein [Planctomycetota bacterium]
MRRAASLAMLCALAVLGVRGPAARGEEPVGADLEAARGALGRRLAAHRGELDAEEGAYAAQHLRLLGAAGRSVTTEALAAARDAGDVAWMRALVAVLADDRDASVDPTLLDLVQHDDPTVQALAADGLGQPRTREASMRQRVADALSACATSPMPAVRWSALRSLMALDDAEARTARTSWPDDPDPRSEATRLHWHARSGDRQPETISRAERLWRDGVTLDVRLEAADLLAEHDAPTAPDVLRQLVDRLDAPHPPGASRSTLPWDEEGPRRRRIAIEAAMSWWERVVVRAGGLEALDADTRAAARAVLDHAVEQIARPVAMDSRDERPQPETRLAQWLPGVGPALVPYVVKRLERGAFYEPGTGVRLLAALEPEVVVPVLQDLARLALGDLPARGSLLSAVTGVLVDIGHMADADLARRLLLDDDAKPWARSDMLRLLARDPASWVAALLEEALRSGDGALRDDVRRTLAARPEATARALRIEAFFNDPYAYGHDRLAELVRAGDGPALDVLARALADERHGVRRLALEQIRPRVTTLHTPAVLDLVRPAGAWVRDPLEVQAYVYALLVLAPGEAVTWVATQFDQLASDAIRSNSLRILQEVRGAEASRAAVDLALDTWLHAPRPEVYDAAVASVLRGRWTWRRPEVIRFWRGLLVPWHPLRNFALGAVASPDAPVLTDLLVPWLAALRNSEDDITTRQHLVEALAYQPWDEVEGILVESVFDPLLPFSTRDAAVAAMQGRLRPRARWRIMRWLGWPLPDGADESAVVDQAEGRGAMDDPGLHVELAVAVARGGGPEIARALLQALDRELTRWIRAQPSPSASLEVRLADQRAQSEAEERLRALARGIAASGDDAVVRELLSRAFDGRLGRIASRRLGDLRRIGAEGRGLPRLSRPGKLVEDRGAYDLRLEAGLPAPAGHILGQAKALDDDTLSACLAGVIQDARRNGGLAQCPDAYLTMAICNLLDAPTHRRPKSAALLLEPLSRIAPGAGGVRRVATDAWMGWCILEQDYAQAAAVERATVHDLLHRQIEDDEGDAVTWRRFHALALEGAAQAARGDVAAAEATWAAALAVEPDRPLHLNTIAWYRRETKTDLARAERDVRRALELEARADVVSSLASADTLAMILLDTGRAQEAARRLAARLHRAEADRTGIYHLHMAEIEAALGSWGACHDDLVDALRRDPASEAAWRKLPWHAAQPEGLALFDSAAREARRNPLDR